MHTWAFSMRSARSSSLVRFKFDTCTRCSFRRRAATLSISSSWYTQTCGERSYVVMSSNTEVVVRIVGSLVAFARCVNCGPQAFPAVSPPNWRSDIFRWG